MYPVCMWHGRTEPLYSLHLTHVPECNSSSEAFSQQLWPDPAHDRGLCGACAQPSTEEQGARREKEQKQPENEMSGKVELVLCKGVRSGLKPDHPRPVLGFSLTTLHCWLTAAPLHSEGLFSLRLSIFEMYTFLKTNIIHVHGKNKCM